MKRWHVVVIVSLIIFGLFLANGGLPYVKRLVNRAPTARFSYRTAERTLEYIPPTEKDTIIFTSQSIDPDGDLLAHIWTINGTIVGSEKLLSVRLAPGLSSVALTVSDGFYENTHIEQVLVEPFSLYPAKGLDIPYKGINYSVGNQFTGSWGAPSTENEMEESLQVIRDELGCNAIKICGDQEDAMLRCAEKAIEKRFELIIVSPRYARSAPNVDGTLDDHLRKITLFSKRVEDLRKKSPQIVLCVGEELTHSVIGISNASTYKGRTEEIYPSSGPAPDVERKINDWLARIVKNVKEYFHGPITYSSSYRDTFLVKWKELAIDLIGPMVYYAGDEAAVLRRIAAAQEYGKLVIATEVGCTTYEGASRYGGNAWARYSEQPYSQLEQARGIDENLQLLSVAGADGVFVHTWVSRTLQDANSYGIMKFSQNDVWTRKLGFYAYQRYMRNSSFLDQLPTFTQATPEIHIEAEDLRLATPFGTPPVKSQDASGGYYVKDSVLAFRLILERDMHLALWGKVRGLSQLNNSFWVRIDQGPLLFWNLPVRDQLTWDQMQNYGEPSSAVIRLRKGIHIFLVFTRELGSEIDVLRIRPV